MDLGVSIFPTDVTPPPGALAQMCEQRGIESLWVTEHTHIPSSRATPYPAGGELPREYARTLDPFVALTAAAAVTSTLKVGTGICLVVEHDPIVLAKQVASLDVVSDGRLLFGVGAGWNREEMANHGTDPKTRMRLLAERVEAMKAIWTQDEASFDGEFVSFQSIWSWPKPVQEPHPPVLVGGNGPTVFDRVLGFGDAWMPNNVGVGAVTAQVAELRERAGRHVPVTLNAGSTDPEKLEVYAQAGIDRVVTFLPQDGMAACEARVDKLLAGARQAGVAA